MGGYFAVVGDVIAHNIAKRNGISRKALNSGVNSAVYALAVSVSDVYEGGAFTTAGGNAANCIAISPACRKFISEKRGFK